MRCVISFDESIRREIRLSERMGLDIASTSKNRMPFDKAKSAAARRRNEVWNRAQTIITVRPLLTAATREMRRVGLLIPHRQRQYCGLLSVSYTHLRAH